VRAWRKNRLMFEISEKFATFLDIVPKRRLPAMNVAQHAGKILAAWNTADPVTFELELENALHSCSRAAPVERLEYEQQEVLQSVIERLQLMGAPGGRRRSGHAGVKGAAIAERPELEPADMPAGSGSLHAGFALLEHLSQRAGA
jgi:hypothetical protein